jgi:hypothetical protein
MKLSEAEGCGWSWGDGLGYGDGWGDNNGSGFGDGSFDIDDNGCGAVGGFGNVYGYGGRDHVPCIEYCYDLIMK